MSLLNSSMIDLVLPPSECQWKLQRREFDCSKNKNVQRRCRSVMKTESEADLIFWLGQTRLISLIFIGSSALHPSSFTYFFHFHDELYKFLTWVSELFRGFRVHIKYKCHDVAQPSATTTYEADCCHKDIKWVLAYVEFTKKNIHRICIQFPG